MYTTIKDLDRARVKAYDGSLNLWSNQWLDLLNAKGSTISGRFLENGEVLLDGSNVVFPCHRAKIQSCIISPPEVRDSDLLSCDASMSVHASLALGLDFSWGMNFQKRVKHCYGSTVHPLGKANNFLLVTSFGRAKFKLDEDSVSLALESCIGGLCDDLDVRQLGERVFRFSVNSKAVGFMVYALKSFACDAFKCYFHLWGNAGLAWQREFVSWQSECQQEWTLISPNKRRTDKAILALRKRPSRSALKSSKGKAPVGRRLNFVTYMSYPACQGYEYQATPAENEDMIQAGYSCPQIQRRSSRVILPDRLELSEEERRSANVQFGSIQSPPISSNSKFECWACYFFGP
jgi:hypothetical protein